MKKNTDINNSLSNIKKALRDKNGTNSIKNDDSNFFLLENVIEKKLPHKKKKIEIDSNTKTLNKNISKKIDISKKNKIKKEKTSAFKKPINKKKPVEIVINEEIRPIIQKWIRKNLRTFVKKVVVEEFKVIPKAAFKQNSASK